MNTLVYNGLTDDEKLVTGTLAKAATIRLGRGETLADLTLEELRAYCIISELNLSVSLVELLKRDAPAEGRLQ